MTKTEESKWNYASEILRRLDRLKVAVDDTSDISCATLRAVVRKLDTADRLITVDWYSHRKKKEEN